MGDSFSALLCALVLVVLCPYHENKVVSCHHRSRVSSQALPVETTRSHLFLFLGFILLLSLSGAKGAVGTAEGTEILLLEGGGLGRAAGLLSPGLLVDTLDIA